ncbi:unnamed protein product [Trichogramma brassicae]|uniref:Uncharacterized protein n=1 Tax=Trichogramma brassicae TaxID=86971 RepID=A0A6H5I460_9HYME|nr:unnamed protein product [Trichogramma brassicae]
MPAPRSLEESASPQARAPEISDLGRPPVHRFTTRRGFALDIEASHALVMMDMRLDAISSAVPGATDALDMAAEKRPASSVRAFHSRLWRIEGLVEVPVSSISKKMA